MAIGKESTQVRAERGEQIPRKLLRDLQVCRRFIWLMVGDLTAAIYLLYHQTLVTITLIFMDIFNHAE